MEMELPIFLIRCQKALPSFRYLFPRVEKVIRVRGTHTKPTPNPAKVLVHASSKADRFISKLAIYIPAIPWSKKPNERMRRGSTFLLMNTSRVDPHSVPNPLRARKSPVMSSG
jgi:hypothetical protein